MKEVGLAILIPWNTHFLRILKLAHAIEKHSSTSLQWRRTVVNEDQWEEMEIMKKWLTCAFVKTEEIYCYCIVIIVICIVIRLSLNSHLVIFFVWLIHWSLFSSCHHCLLLHNFQKNISKTMHSIEFQQEHIFGMKLNDICVHLEFRLNNRISFQNREQKSLFFSRMPLTEVLHPSKTY